jgi:hypothetical protein
MLITVYGVKFVVLPYKKQHGLMILEETVLRGIFELRGEEVTGDERKFRSAEFNNF